MNSHSLVNCRIRYMKEEEVTTLRNAMFAQRIFPTLIQVLADSQLLIYACVNHRTPMMG